MATGNLRRLYEDDQSELRIDTLCEWNWAEYKQALDLVERLYCKEAPGFAHPLVLLDEAAVALANAAFLAGAAAGAAYEHAPNSVPVIEEVCSACGGYGRDSLDWHSARRPLCESCGGCGVVSALESLPDIAPTPPN